MSEDRITGMAFSENCMKAYKKKTNIKPVLEEYLKNVKHKEDTEIEVEFTMDVAQTMSFIN